MKAGKVALFPASIWARLRALFTHASMHTQSSSQPFCRHDNGYSKLPRSSHAPLKIHECHAHDQMYRPLNH